MIDTINPIHQLAGAQGAYSQAQQDVAFGEYLTSQAIFGQGDPNVARQFLSQARAMMGHQLQNEKFWTDVVKENKNRFKRGWELVKDA